MQNAFANHFLTDAFSAGHLFNKRDVMEKFNGQLPTTGQGDKREFTKGSAAFFDDIAKAAFVGDVDAEFSKYETVEKWHGIFRPNINSASRFSLLLQGIHLEKPELLESAVAKGIHDKLNTHAGGVPVENMLGDQWPLSGDGTLNAQTLAVIRRAVAQSQQNIISVFGSSNEPDFAALFKKVWDFTPHPTAEGRKIVTGAIQRGSDVSNNDLRTAIVDLIKANYLTIIAEHNDEIDRRPECLAFATGRLHDAHKTTSARRRRRSCLGRTSDLSAHASRAKLGAGRSALEGRAGGARTRRGARGADLRYRASPASDSEAGPARAGTRG
jgi:hypothetical protein